MRPVTTVVMLASLLAGCGGNGGYVESDIPGLAPALMRIHQERVDTTCPTGTSAVKVFTEASTRTTSSGFQRERIAYKVHCN